MILLVLLLLDGRYSYWYTRVSRQLFDNTILLLAPILKSVSLKCILLEYIFQSRPITVVIEIDLHQRPRIPGKSLKEFHEVLLLEGRRIPLLQYSQVDLLQKYLELFLWKN